MSSDAEARQAIRETINAYSGAAGRLDIDAFVAFFTPDAQVHGIAGMFGQAEPFAGHQALRDFFGASFANLEWLVQNNTITDVAVAADGKTATASTGLVELAKPRGGDQIVLIARYDDRLVLTAEGWKFSRRTLTPYRFSTVP